ncbi:N-formylglutamate amidohydrolase [Novosphingobium guangzhouense]|uniref:N-formylglutamate amidohydrolase n=1 Tax=Novosphingobium guangzhouense TaxID=1850347 RepID=A0A2K2FVQ0_9SPHN|nr:N-formylglutamate amidohydrolase [Novosphingobium guangzhouense]PNU02828.1 N-formylglutamate amidohydrolase [Novosphingobium guangzhouense]
MAEQLGENDSQGEGGGRIPGAPSVPAFFLEEADPSVLPVLIAAPHGGRHYPRSLVADLRHGAAAALRLEDRYVDLMARGVAQATGASLIVANAPRAMIDLNRAPDDVDWDMFPRDARPAGAPAPSRRVRGGLGLIPRRLPALGDLWRRRLGPVDLAERVAGVHEPYHAAIAGELARLRQNWGAALLIDLHSMPPLPSAPGVASAQVVVGDRFGASSSGSIVASAFAHFAQVAREAAHNRPYAGGYVLERHADPRGGIHALQIEIDRSRYLDSALVEPSGDMAGMIEDLAGLVRRLGAIVAELGERQARDAAGPDWPLAAE